MPSRSRGSAFAGTIKRAREKNKNRSVVSRDPKSKNRRANSAFEQPSAPQVNVSQPQVSSSSNANFSSISGEQQFIAPPSTPQQNASADRLFNQALNPTLPSVPAQGNMLEQGVDIISSKVQSLQQDAEQFRLNYQANVAKLQERGGWKNLVDVMSIVINPFNMLPGRDKIQSHTGVGPVDTVVGGAASYPYATALGAAIASVAAAGSSTSSTAVSQSGKVGLASTAGGATGGVASTVAVNTATQKASASQMTKAASAAGLGASVPAVVGGTMATIGTYPFAGFIKEEALQTLSFAIKSATDSGNLDLADEAIAFQKKLLDPDYQQKLMEMVPYANILANLEDYYQAARIKMNIDEKVIADMRYQQEFGESEDEKWARLNAEKLEQERLNIDYFNQERKKLLQWEADARAEQNAEAAALWRKERELTYKMEEEERQRIADFWLEYRKRAQQLSNNSAPSKLSFGII